MTRPEYDDDLLVGLEPEQEPEAAGPELSQSDTPAAEAPEPEPQPAPDPFRAINRLAEEQRQVLELQRQQLERQNQPPAPAAWVDPYDRPEVAAELEALEEEATWNPAARAALRKREREIQDERLNHQLSVREQAIRQEMQAAQQVDTVTQTLRAEARQHGDLVTDDALTEVQNEIFAGQPAHIRANALQDQNLRALIVQAAAGRRVLSGQARPANAPERPAAPPPVRSDSRATGPKSPKADQVAMWNDRNYLESTLDEAMFGKPRTADHEELLK